VQQTIKRTDMKAITVSTKKKCRRGDKSQDQTTSKKTNSGSMVPNVKNEKDNINNVVTPARTSMPRNKLTSIVKSSQEKTSQTGLAKKQPAILGKSTAKKDLNSLEDERLKSTEERAESQPSKKTNVLTKQDSSKYLRGGSSQLPTQYSHPSSSVLSNHKPSYVINSSLLPSGAKMQGNPTETKVTAFQIEDPENTSYLNSLTTEDQNEAKKAREKSVSLSQITKGISLKQKVSCSDTLKSSASSNFLVHDLTLFDY